VKWTAHRGMIDWGRASHLSARDGDTVIILLARTKKGTSDIARAQACGGVQLRKPPKT